MLETLKQLALLGAHRRFISLSSKELGKKLSCSQQTASMRILELLDKGMVERKIGRRKQLLKLTSKGTERLRKEYANYQLIFLPLKKLSIRGRVTSGLGDGRYYMKQREYKEQIQKKLYFSPFEGTLNLKVLKSDLVKLDILKEANGIEIDGFEREERRFGSAKCFPSKVRGVKCAVILPRLSHYRDTIELLSRDMLREKLKLSDGDLVEVKVLMEA